MKKLLIILSIAVVGCDSRYEFTIVAENCDTGKKDTVKYESTRSPTIETAWLHNNKPTLNFGFFYAVRYNTCGFNIINKRKI